MLEQLEHKRSLKLKSIFRPQTNIEIGQKPAALNRKAAAQLQISPPVLQHSTSIYSLVSPTRTVFANIYSSNGNEIPYELYQPISSPPPIPRHKSSWSTSTTPNSTIPTPQNQRIDDAKRELKRPMHPLDLVPDMVIEEEETYVRSRYVDSRKTMAVELRGQYSDVKRSKETYKTNRRHSCSSTTIYKQQQQQQQQEKVFITKQLKNEIDNVKSFRSKLRERRRSGKVNSSYSTAASIASLELPCLEPSKSTPTRKVKTYNVPKKEPIIDADKQRKMQELEDLITGRRGSTLKLTLTPKRLV